MKAPRLFPVLTLGMALSLCSAGAATQVCTEAELRNALATGGSVSFRCDQTLVLTSPLTITKNVELDATGQTVTLSGGGTTRVFEVAPGVTFSLRNLNVINGYHKGANAIYIPPSTTVHGQPGLGGALAATNATIRLSACVFSNNVTQGGDLWEGGPGFPFVPGGAAFGGAIFIEGGEFTSTNCAFVTNRARASEYPGDMFPGLLEWTDSNGGAVSLIGADATLSGCDFDLNRAVTGGGAIHARSSELVIENSMFNLNTVVARKFDRFGRNPEGDGRGGALEVLGSGQCSVRACSFSGNQVTGGGSGLASSSGLLSGGAIFSADDIAIDNSEFLGNFIRGQGYAAPVLSRGGAIYAARAATVIGSRFVNNSVVGGDSHQAGDQDRTLAGNAYGGGLYVAGSLHIASSSCVSNTVTGGNVTGLFSPPTYFGKAQGSAIYASNSVFATNVTIVSNLGRDSTSDSKVGAVYSHGEGENVVSNYFIFCTFATNEFGRLGKGSPTQALHAAIDTNAVAVLRGTILSGGSSNTISGETLDAGFNLTSDDLFTEATSKNATDAKLGTLGLYGGATETLPILAGSPAIDAVIAGSFPATDQRGRMRPFGSAADIGAYELSAPFVAHGWVLNKSVLGPVTLTASGAPVELSETTGEFTGFFPTAGVLKPVAAGIVFHPAEIALTTGVEIFDTNFTGYFLNQVAIEHGEESDLTITFAAETAGEYRLYVSNTLNSWTASGAAQSVPANGLFRATVEATDGPQFFRVGKE